MKRTNEDLADQVHRGHLKRLEAGAIRDAALAKDRLVTAREKRKIDRLESEAWELEDGAFPDLLAQTNGLIWQSMLRYARALDLNDHDREELLQEGNLLLLDCARRFEIERGLMFSTYLCSSLRKLLNFGTEKLSIIHIPRDNAKDGEESRAYRNMMRENKVLSIQQMRGKEKDFKLEALLVAECEPDEDAFDLSEQLYLWLNELPARERQTLEARMQYTLEEVGTMQGVCKERIRQVEKRAMSMLRYAAGVPNEHDKYIVARHKRFVEREERRLQRIAGATM